MVSDAEVLERVQRGELIETVDEMSPGYLDALRITLIVSADTEFISAPAYYRAAQDAPTVNAFISLMAIIQDELGHAHIAYRLLEDLGVDVEALIFDRPPEKWKHPYAFDIPIETWPEMVVANAFYDRAGYKLLGDVYRNTSFGPWKRALAKVDKEEVFHVRHGEMWMKKLAADPDGKRALQRAVDWMFPLTVEWFGLPDHLKRHPAQITFRIKGMTNDELRQAWLSEVVPLCTSLGIHVPAHYDESSGQYVLDYPFPCVFDAERKQWRFDQPCTWDDVLRRWKSRGPHNVEFVEQVRRGYRQMRAWMKGANP